ncbi:doublecortin domain-containing protein 2-like [Centruroides vittatus]|uniref:doublecortin domain-containing protein 2-like n=1 Tax=Centruroides vittatus TaxID=120091 RepID=UPI00350F4B85
MATKKDSKHPSDSNESLDQPSTSNIQTNITEAKWIKVYLNGDEYFPGIKCVINNKHHRNFDVFLNYITQRLQPSFGAVRNIYSPVSGHRVTNLRDLLPNHGYVAAGGERFKRIEAGYAQNKNTKKVITRKPASKIRPTYRNHLKSSLNNRRSSVAEVTVIFVFKNGDDVMPPSKFVFRKRDLMNWEKILETIGKKVQLLTGYVKKLCTLEGKDIKGPEELTNKQSYVAIGVNEHFKFGKYNTQKSVPSQKTLTYQNRILSSSETRTKSETETKSDLDLTENDNEETVEDNISTNSVENNDEKTVLKGTFQNLEQMNEEESKEKTSKLSNGIEGYFYGPGDGIFKAQQRRMLSTITEINLDEDQGGLFRASERSEITNGAKEIQDSADTLVDFPEDEAQAEEIDDEITPEMERAMQDLDLEDSQQIVAFVPSLPNKTSVTPTKQIMRTNTELHSRLQNTFV